jgi:hypothetical protein
MSFPILCIVNAAATLVALEQSYGPEVRIRVNGDDIAFIANPAQYERWKEVTHFCGLDFSVGKNYTSREFVIMNSELRRAPIRREWETRQSEEVSYEWDGDVLVTVPGALVEHPKPWRFEGFVNQCLLYNTIKKGMDAGSLKDTYWTDLSSISGELLRGIPARNQWKLYGIFFKTYNQQIREAPKNANKWFPKALGGMGLSLPPRGRHDHIKEVGGGLIPAEIEFKEVYDEKMPFIRHGYLDTEPKRLLQQQKIAAYLACDPKKRLERVTLKRQIFGALGQAFKDIRALSDSQVPRVLHKKLRNRECTPIMGGTTLLGYLLGVSHLAGGDFDQVGQWQPSPMGGFQPERSGAAHLATAAALRQEYNKWTTKGLQTSLSPMRIDHILEYSEHLEMSSRIEIMRDDVALRLMD